MIKNQVGAVPDDNLGIAQEVIRRLREEAGFPERQKLFLEDKYVLKQGIEIVSRPFAQLEKRLSKRFMKRITVDPYPREFTEGFLRNAAGYNMRPVFLPGEDISADCRLKKWVKLGAEFYQEVKNGDVRPFNTYYPTVLCRGWYLADFSLSVDYTDGTQVYPNDPWASAITQLREEGKIGKYESTPKGSRFVITLEEWGKVLLIYMAAKLLVPPAKIRLERAIEFNAIGNLYDPNRGKFNSWEWFADAFRSSDRICGGCRDCGGLASISNLVSGSHMGNFAGRPLVSFVS